MKKLLSVFIAAAMLFCLVTAGCSPGSSSAGKPEESGSSVKERVTASESTEDLSDYTLLSSAPEYDEVDMTAYTDMYFDADGGDDANDGFSEESPKKSV